jgi:hypothetical protein
MRTKKRPAVATPAINKAWGAFFETVAVADPEQLKKEGWMTNSEIAKQVQLEGEAGRQVADIAFRRGVMEKKAVKILLNGKRQKLNFYRPK